MRTCGISVRGNQTLEIFCSKKTEGFDVWTVGLVKGVRSILHRLITHDDWEARLHYAKHGDVAWKDASPTDVPTEKHVVALEQEKLILNRGKFQDSDNLCYDIANSLNLITTDRKSANVAKKAMLGRWTDGIATVTFGQDSKLELSLQPHQKHPFDLCMRVNGLSPNWWSFVSWTLHLMHTGRDQKCGQRTSVIHVDAHELHVYSNERDRIAHIFQRQKLAHG
jgi:hypothetical protein